MAKTDPDLNDDTIILDDWEPPAPTAPGDKEGPYDRWVLATIAADEKLSRDDPEAYAEGKRKRVSIVVKTGDPKEKDGETIFPDVDKERRLFQDSARFRERTAKVVGTTDEGNGFTRISFILVPKQKRTRLSAEEKAARAQENDVATQESADAA